MDNISQTIHELPAVTFPPGLHGKIMRQLFFLKFRVPFFVVSALLFCNIAISGYHAWLRMVDTEAFSIASVLWEGFEWSFDFFSEFMRTVVAYFPIGWLAMFTINSLLLGYVIFLYFSFTKDPVINL